MTLKQKLLLYAAVILAAWLFTWPIGLAMILFFCEVNGDIPTYRETDD